VVIKDEPQEGGDPGTGGPVAEIDPNPHVTFNYLGRSDPKRFGVVSLRDRKRLTFSDDGGTNTSVVNINGQTGEFGAAAGRWLERDVKLPPDPRREARNGSRSVWAVGGVHFTQVLEVVPSKQPVNVGGMRRRVLDTVLIRYVVENKDREQHTVGMRIQVDTLIGNNDGVPFTVPGLPGLVNTFADFRTPDQVPDFIQALEIPNLQNPGTVAHMTLKLGGGVEPPGRVSLTHWSGGDLNWEVPVRHMGGDSAVILYWEPRPLRPGARREFGFAY